MINRAAADLVVLLHLGFILFVVAGAVVVARWPRAAAIHIPCVLWGAWIELSGRICPLTPLENRLRAAAGDHGYQGGFVEQYILPVIYPGRLTPGVQVALGIGVLALNLIIYGTLIYRRSRRARARLAQQLSSGSGVAVQRRPVAPPRPGRTRSGEGGDGPAGP